jgi:hypothetical protein
MQAQVQAQAQVQVRVWRRRFVVWVAEFAVSKTSMGDREICGTSAGASSFISTSAVPFCTVSRTGSMGVGAGSAVCGGPTVKGSAILVVLLTDVLVEFNALVTDPLDVCRVDGYALCEGVGRRAVGLLNDRRWFGVNSRPHVTLHFIPCS